MATDRTPLPHALCRHLCCKRLYMLPEDHDLHVEDLYSAGEDNFWCRLTQTDNGPDQQWVRYERCAPGRVCYAPRESAPAGGE